MSDPRESMPEGWAKPQPKPEPAKPAEDNWDKVLKGEAESAPHAAASDAASAAGASGTQVSWANFADSGTPTLSDDYSCVQVMQDGQITGPWTARQAAHLFDTGSFRYDSVVRGRNGKEWGGWRPFPDEIHRLRPLAAFPISGTEVSLYILGVVVGISGLVLLVNKQVVLGVAAGVGALQVFASAKILHHLRQR